MTAEACVRWRNFIPTANDLNVSGKTNTAIEIELNDQLLQGANPIDMDVINEKQFQGAFRLNFAVTVNPVHGKLENSLTGTGWRYYPLKDYVGSDEFYYVLGNGTQNSAEAKVTITITEGLSGSITVVKAVDRPYWKFYGTHNIPTSFGPYDMIVYTWIEKRPMRIYYLGEPYIYINDTIIQSSSVTFDVDTAKPSTVALRDSVDWRKYVWPDPNLSGYLPHTATPYIQPPSPFLIVLKIDFFGSPIFEGDGTVDSPITFVAWDVHDTIEIDVESDKGADWWANGLVQNVEPDDPDYPRAPMYP